jgi:hypothetical protein
MTTPAHEANPGKTICVMSYLTSCAVTWNEPSPMKDSSRLP